MTARRHTRFQMLAYILCGFVTLGALFEPLALSQAKNDSAQPAPSPSSPIDISDAMTKAKPNDPSSLYFVERLAQARATQAIPLLEAKFAATTDTLDKSHIASALVRLGDKNDLYWNYLFSTATAAAQNDAPDFMVYDAQGKAGPGPSPEFLAWATTHRVSPQTAGQDAVYVNPGEVALLAMTGDARAIPLLRQALHSPNHQMVIVAARGLAHFQDKESIPVIIDVCQKAPADARIAIAGYLVYFDDVRAQSAVDEYVPESLANQYRIAKASGRTPF